MKPHEILNDPLLNKGTGFTQKERDALHLHGFLPCGISTLEQQVERRYQNFRQQSSDLGRYLFLTALQNRNETLFYRLVYEHVCEMLPYIYTPTVGKASEHYSLLYTQQRGIYFSYPLKDRIEEIVQNIAIDDIDVIVATDGERILGLGDLGSGGMAIPVGKLALYTLFGGIHPKRTLPVMLDVGTNNALLLDDPLYLGWRHKRVSGKEYDDFVDAFVQAIKKRYPRVLLQWEDFGKEHAKPLLDRYESQLCSFNDDIQGTASVVLAAILAAVKLNKTKLVEQKIVLFGGGSAGIGVCNLIIDAMKEEKISEEEARKAFYVIDINGLIHTGLKGITPAQMPFARKKEEVAGWGNSLLDVIEKVRPTVLIGVSTQAGAFNEQVVTAMARYVERPVIFPLSNPTSKSEAHPADLIRWTKGKAVIATGSPFDPVEYQGKTYPIAQCNNVSIFPGVGLGLISCKAKRVVNRMFYKAAHILSDHSPMLRDPYGTLFPPFENLREISKEIAAGIVEVAQEEGLSPKTSHKEIQAMVERTMWFPKY